MMSRDVLMALADGSKPQPTPFHGYVNSFTELKKVHSVKILPEFGSSSKNIWCRISPEELLPLYCLLISKKRSCTGVLRLHTCCNK